MRRAAPSFLPFVAVLLVSCVSVRTVQPPEPRLPAKPEALLVLVNEGTFGTRQAQRFADALRDELASARLDARIVIVGAKELADDSLLARAREGRRTLLRIVPIAATRLVGEVSQITYDASLTRIADDARLWHITLDGKSGALSRQLKRRDRRLARELVRGLRGED